MYLRYIYLLPYYLNINKKFYVYYIHYANITRKPLQIFHIVNLMNSYHENRYLRLNLQNDYLSQSFDGSLLRKKFIENKLHCISQLKRS